MSGRAASDPSMSMGSTAISASLNTTPFGDLTDQELSKWLSSKGMGNLIHTLAEAQGRGNLSCARYLLRISYSVNQLANILRIDKNKANELLTIINDLKKDDINRVTIP